VNRVRCDARRAIGVAKIRPSTMTTAWKGGRRRSWWTNLRDCHSYCLLPTSRAYGTPLVARNLTQRLVPPSAVALHRTLLRYGPTFRGLSPTGPNASIIHRHVGIPRDANPFQTRWWSQESAPGRTRRASAARKSTLPPESSFDRSIDPPLMNTVSDEDTAPTLPADALMIVCTAPSVRASGHPAVRSVLLREDLQRQYEMQRHFQNVHSVIDTSVWHNE
jgi:hypothetical protein